MTMALSDDVVFGQLDWIRSATQANAANPNKEQGSTRVEAHFPDRWCLVQKVRRVRMMAGRTVCSMFVPTVCCSPLLLLRYLGRKRNPNVHHARGGYIAGTQLPLGRFFDGKKANSEMYDWENRQRATVARAAVALPYPSLPSLHAAPTTTTTTATTVAESNAGNAKRNVRTSATV